VPIALTLLALLVVARRLGRETALGSRD